MSEPSREPKEGGSVPQSRSGFMVEASPLNGVKLELAVALVGAVSFYALLEVLLETGWLQVGLLAGYGIAACAWLVTRARNVVHGQRPSGSDAP